MLDDLRDKADNEDFFGENADEPEHDHNLSLGPALFLGMTPVQRLVIAGMILLMACVMGSFLLLVTEKVYLPFV